LKSLKKYARRRVKLLEFEIMGVGAEGNKWTDLSLLRSWTQSKFDILIRQMRSDLAKIGIKFDNAK
jgi:hypothetical protein